MSRQKTLFSEPEPDHIEPLPGCDMLDDDEPPYGPLMYLQELYASMAADIGAARAGPIAQAAWANYRQEGVK